MRTSRTLARQIVETYASVLYDAAAQSDSVDATSTQLDAVLRLVRGQAPLRDLLLDDTVPAEKRAAIVRDVFAGLRPVLVETLAVMVERDNFDLLGSVAEEYGRIAEERRGTVAVDVTTAVELTDTLRASISRKLTADLGREVILREKVDPGIIGGIIISTHGHRLDASITSQLEAARAVLSTAPSGGEA